MNEKEIVIGRNAVREAIRSGRSIEAVYVSARAEGSIREILALAKKNGVTVKEVPKAKLDELSLPYGHGDAPGNHQGIAARVSGVIYQSIEDMFALAEQRKEAPFLIMLDGIEDPFNLGAIVRSAEVLGAHGVILPKRRSTGMTAAACKTASGSSGISAHCPGGELGSYNRGNKETRRFCRMCGYGWAGGCQNKPERRNYAGDRRRRYRSVQACQGAQRFCRKNCGKRKN